MMNSQFTMPDKGRFIFCLVLCLPEHPTLCIWLSILLSLFPDLKEETSHLPSTSLVPGTILGTSPSVVYPKSPTSQQLLVPFLHLRLGEVISPNIMASEWHNLIIGLPTSKSDAVSFCGFIYQIVNHKTQLDLQDVS